MITDGAQRLREGAAVQVLNSWEKDADLLSVVRDLPW